MCNFPGAVIKDIATFTLFSWITHPGGSQMPCYEATQPYREGTQMEKNWDLPPAANIDKNSLSVIRKTTLEGNLSASGKTLNDCSPSSHLTATSLMLLSQKDQKTCSSIDHPQTLNKMMNNDCLKSQCFELMCDAAIER